MTKALVALKDEEVAALRELVLSDTPEGYATYYTFASGSVFPKHAWAWVQAAYEGRAKHKDTAIEGFRGSRKTTYFTDYFTSYQIGLHPERTNIFIQASEESATDNAKFVASIIKTNKAFRYFFPHVVPDEKGAGQEGMGWGSEGYWVKRDDMPYGEWRHLCSKDPTLVGAGYKSQILIGKHPNGLLILDDLHDHHNTRSKREFKYTLDVYNKIISYMPTNTTWVIHIFTPWVEGDVGWLAKKNPTYVHCRTPAYIEVNGQKTDEPMWPEEFPRERLLEMAANMAHADFAQMMLLDLEAAKGINLKEEWVHFFPADAIDRTWPVYIGVDYASIASEQERKTTKRDYFALLVGRIQPATGNLIIVDGFFGHLTQSEGESKVKEFVNRYHPLRVGVEQIGKGEEFYQHLLKRGLRTHIAGQTVGNRSKGERFEIQMAPLFSEAKVWLSDDPNNPALDEFFKEWKEWDGFERYYDDMLDAAWHLIRVCKNLIRQTPDDDKPDVRQSKKDKKKSPLAGFGWTGKRRHDGRTRRT